MSIATVRMRAAVIGAVSLALLAGCTLLPGSVADLNVGDCFDEPAAEGDVTDVQHQPCDQPHDAEVFLVLQHPAPATEAYPVVSGFDDYVGESCIPAFLAYTGRDFNSQTEFDLGYFRPTLTGWGDGDREFTCYISRSDGAKLNAPVGTSPSAAPSST